MTKSVLSLVAFLGTLPLTAQVSNVSPTPQQVVNSSDILFDAPQKWNITAPKGFVHDALTKALATDAKSKFKLIVKIDPKKAPKHTEGYTLNITRKGATIVATDINGAFYGAQTLLAIAKDGKLQECQITDYPDVPFRGVVEGFYGTPWSKEARLSQLEFYGKHKMNVYIFGPKDDPYHREKWRLPYPEEEARGLKELVDKAHENGVQFYWAIHPGGDIKWNTEDRDALISKLEKMYELGIRSFAVFFDDIWGEGANALKQAELLNYVDQHFVQAKKDVSPLILCPTIYNKAWNGDGSYLAGLKEKLNKSVHVMWTGNTVVHDIDVPSMQWINERIGSKAYIWWNFAVSDYVRDHLLLGPTYGNSLDIAPLLSGFVSNPMEHAEASKLSLYGVGEYTWNMKAYDPMKAWERAIAEILPSNPKALQTFASYNEDPGPNTHGYRREESRELKPIAQRAINGDATAIATLGQKAVELGQAATLLLADNSNPALHKELRPWLLQAQLVAQYGYTVANMKTPMEFEVARALQKQMYDLSSDRSIQHATQTGIKVGTSVLMPTLNQVFANKVKAYNTANGTDISPIAEYNPFRMEATVGQLVNQGINFEGNKVSVRPVLEVVTWAPNASFTITGDKLRTLRGLSFDFGAPGIESNFKLEVGDGNTWKTISLLQYNSKSNTINTGKEINGVQATHVRLTNVSGKQLQLHFRDFNFSVE